LNGCVISKLADLGPGAAIQNRDDWPSCFSKPNSSSGPITGTIPNARLCDIGNGTRRYPSSKSRCPRKFTYAISNTRTFKMSCLALIRSHSGARTCAITTIDDRWYHSIKTCSTPMTATIHAYLACEGLTGIGVVTIVGVFSWTDTAFSTTSNRAFC